MWTSGMALLLFLGAGAHVEDKRTFREAFPDEVRGAANTSSKCCTPGTSSGEAGALDTFSLRTLVDTSDFPPRWRCGIWSSAHGWTHILADSLIWGAYTSIPVILVYYIRKRRDVPFPRIFWLFALFILACGTGHLVEAGIFWWPAYRVSALVKVITATVSWLTVIALMPVIPKALALPGLKKINESLEEEIKRRATAEENLRDRSTRLASIVNTAADAIITIDQNGVIESANGTAERMFGWKAEEMIGRNVGMLMPPADRDRHNEYLRAYLKTGHAKVIGIGREVTAMRRDGTTFEADLAVSEMLVGNRRSFTGIVRDISERKQAEELFRRTVEAAPNGMLLVGLDGTISMVNTQIEKLFGYDRGDLVGQPVELLVPARCRESHIADRNLFFNAPSARPTGLGRDFSGRRRDGSEFPIEIGLNPVRIRGTQYVLASVIDITQRMETLKELAAQAKELRHTNAALARKNAELDEFSSVASHDLQEPLRKLISFSELLKTDLGGDLPERAATDIKFITEAASRMRSLVEDLLTLSRAGRSVMKREHVSLEECADRAIAALAARIEETHAVLEREPLPAVIGDATLLTQLYQNLMGNALKFHAADRQPVIRLTVEQKDGVWELGVKDNGIGIKPEYREQIFAPFRRLHGRGEFDGSGIGLAICRKAVERHGGHIWVESEPDQGSHFKFTLNADKEALCLSDSGIAPSSCL